MTLPDTPFVCKNIDVEAVTIEIDKAHEKNLSGSHHEGFCEACAELNLFSQRVIAAALGEVIPARRDRRTLRMYGSRGPDQVRYITKFQPVVSDKE
jgi:hypothetical protein